MALTDNDLELLDSYLDDEMSMADADLLRSRLGAEPELSSALEELRADRAARGTMYASLEGDDATAARLMKNIKRELVRETLFVDRSRRLRSISAAAAMIVLGLLVGWVGRGRTGSAGPAIVGTNLGGMMPTTGDPSPQPGGVITLVGVPLNPTPADPRQLPRPSGYNVYITDAFNRIVGQKHFDSFNDTRDFVGDLGRSQQNRQSQFRNVEDVPKKDKF